MKDQKSIEKRRKILKTLILGSGVAVTSKSLPNAWRKPIVETVLLPAHAGTTDITQCPMCEGEYCAQFVDQIPQSLTIVLSGENVSVQGDSVAGPSSGSGTCNNGMFSVTMVNGPEATLLPHVVSGTIADDCSQITGELVFESPGGTYPFTASPNFCFD